MALWGSTDQANNAPKNQNITGVAVANGSALYGNVTVGAFIGNAVVGVYGVTVAEATVADGDLANPGWVLVRQGTGPVSAVNVTAGGSGYNNTDVGTVSNGAVNASFSLVTNSTGGITSTTVTSGGGGFINAAAVGVAIANSTGGATGGTSATFTVTLGGRAGRVQYETLVAIGSITGDGTDDALFPDT